MIIKHEDIEVGCHVVVFNYDCWSGKTKGKEYLIKYVYDDGDSVGFINNHGEPDSAYLETNPKYIDEDFLVEVREANPETVQMRKEFKALLEDSESEIGSVNARLREHGMEFKLAYTGQEEPSVDWHSSSIGC